MKDYTAKEIARALGITKRPIEKRAAKEAWPYIEQAVRGGKQRVYTYETLPEAVKAAISANQTAPADPEITIVTTITIVTRVIRSKAKAK